MKNKLIIEGEVSYPINDEERPDGYGTMNSCIFATVSCYESDTGYYELDCNIIGKRPCEIETCPFIAKYKIYETD